MSIALCMVGKNGIVMSTDSRRIEEALSGRDRRHADDEVKLHKLNCVGLTHIGAVSNYGNSLISRYKGGRLERHFNTWQVVESFASFVRNDIDTYATQKGNDSDETWLIFLLAGYSPKNKPEIYKLDNSGDLTWFSPDLVPSPYCCVGVGEQIARSWLNRLKVEKMDVEMLKRLSVFLILEAANVSDYVNRSIQMCVITKSSFQRVSRAEISKLKSGAEGAKEELVDVFSGYLGLK